MKAEFTLHRPHGEQIKFTVEAPEGELDWLENMFTRGNGGAIVRRNIPYDLETDAPWPVGPRLEDM